jgi:hypothetical protein
MRCVLIPPTGRLVLLTFDPRARLLRSNSHLASSELIRAEVLHVDLSFQENVSAVVKDHPLYGRYSVIVNRGVGRGRGVVCRAESRHVLLM